MLRKARVEVRYHFTRRKIWKCLDTEEGDGIRKAIQYLMYLGDNKGVLIL